MNTMHQNNGKDEDERKKDSSFASESASASASSSYEVESQSILDALTEEEKEHAARSSYRYLISSIQEENHPMSDQRDEIAMAMARRYLVASKGNQKIALKRLRATLEHRIKVDVDGLRLCFHSSDEQKYEEYRSQLERQFAMMKFFVQGKDKKGRPMCVINARLPAKNIVVSAEWLLNCVIYGAERTFACIERATAGREEKTLIVYDFRGFTIHDIAPMHLTKNTLFWIKDHVPERIEKIFMVDAPPVFRAFWQIIKIFVDPITRRTVRFVHGQEEKRKVLGELIEDDQAFDWLFQEGTLEDTFDQKSPEILKKYLYETPFDEPYQNGGSDSAIKPP